MTIITTVIMWIAIVSDIMIRIFPKLFENIYINNRNVLYDESLFLIKHRKKLKIFNNDPSLIKRSFKCIKESVESQKS